MVSWWSQNMLVCHVCSGQYLSKLLYKSTGEEKLVCVIFVWCAVVAQADKVKIDHLTRQLVNTDSDIKKSEYMIIHECDGILSLIGV